MSAALVSFMQSEIRKYEREYSCKLKELWVNATLLDAYISYCIDCVRDKKLTYGFASGTFIEGKLMVYKPDPDDYFTMLYFNGTEIFQSRQWSRNRGMEC